MWHRRRRWQVSLVDSAEELTDKLTRFTWTPCTGFQVRGSPYLFLNDATSPDGAQEWAIVLGEGEAFPQVESITFSWCQPFEAREYVAKALAGRYAYLYDLIDPKQVETPDPHGSCRHCR